MANPLDNMFSDLMGELKAKEKADKTLKRKDATPAEIAEANRIRQEWIDVEWRDTAFGPMFLRQVCTNCGARQQQFGGFFLESCHVNKRETTRLVRVASDVQVDDDLARVRYFREEEVDYCAAPGCIEGFDDAPWKR